MTRPLMLRRLTPKDPPDEIHRRITARAWDAAGRRMHDGVMFGRYDIANRRLCFGRGSKARNASRWKGRKIDWHEVVYTLFEPSDMGVEVQP